MIKFIKRFWLAILFTAFTVFMFHSAWYFESEGMFVLALSFTGVSYLTWDENLYRGREPKVKKS